MARADSGSVLGDFAGRRVETSAGTVHFFTRKGRYFIRPVPADGRPRDYPVLHTFGHYPLQQYLLPTENGRLQAFTVAWDSRPAAEGGQRWFEPQAGAAEPLPWTSQLLNWNGNCADCHSTRVQQGYDPETNRFDTRFVAVNIGCEACHGPGARHLAAVRRGAPNPGNLLIRGARRNWARSPKARVATPSASAAPAAELVKMCGGCHSRRTRLGDAPAADYHEQYRLTLLREGLYHPDGRILDEVFVLGSFMQSRMYQAGVTCNDCHDSHSGRLRKRGNGLCLGCHAPEVYDEGHSRHVAGSPGNLCVNCHMPARVYMGVDARRDHRLAVPESGGAGLPEVCNDCHAAAGLSPAPPTPPPPPDRYRQLHQRLLAADPEVAGELADMRELPPIEQATLVSQLHRLHPSRFHPLLPAKLRDDNLLVRSAALSLAGFLPPAQRRALVSPLLTDPSRRVRLDAALALAPFMREQEVLPGLPEAVTELRKSLAHTAWLPSSQTTLGRLEYELGNPAAAGAAWRHALVLEPAFVPALLNLADLHRARGEEAAAAAVLEKALQLAGDAPAVQYSYGLSLIRRGRHREALVHLRRAADSPDGEASFAYTHAVALEAVAGTQAAIDYLAQARRARPFEFSLTLLQILYLQRAKAPAEELTPLVRQLMRIAPEAPETRRLMRSYGLQ